MLSERTSNALIGISSATLKEGVRIKHLFRIMTHCPDLWLRAYANIYANRGATTTGVSGNTMDGMSKDRINNLISLLKEDSYQPHPVKRVFIPKSNGKKRPLGIPTGDDKLVQEVVKIMLESIYEPVFSQNSHGFRPKRSCHTALRDVAANWTGVKWVVDMDIASFYDSIDHEKLIEVLERKIDDRKFLALIKKMLKAGYLEDWKFHGTYSGTPQGGICSPTLANIFLHELDQFMEKKRQGFDRGVKRRPHPEYQRLTSHIGNRRRMIEDTERKGCFAFASDCLKEDIKEADALRKKLPSFDMYDDGFKRLRYVRYADDFVIGVIGSHDDANQIRQNVEEFLGKGLKLRVSPEKSGIHNMVKGFDFLGYHVRITPPTNQYQLKVRCGTTAKGRAIFRTSRSAVARVHLSLPLEKVWSFCRRKGYWQNDRAVSRPGYLAMSDYEIVALYNTEMRGFANFYSLADRRRVYLMQNIALCSLFLTLANKHKVTPRQKRSSMKRGGEHVVNYQLDGKSKVLKVFKLKHLPPTSWNDDRCRDTEPRFHPNSHGTELIARMNASKCEYCSKHDDKCEVHHIRKLKDLTEKKQKSSWELWMIARQRKTMVLCQECHHLLHAGKLQGWKRNVRETMESAVQ